MRSWTEIACKCSHVASSQVISIIHVILFVRAHVKLHVRLCHAFDLSNATLTWGAVLEHGVHQWFPWLPRRFPPPCIK